MTDFAERGEAMLSALTDVPLVKPQTVNTDRPAHGSLPFSPPLDHRTSKSTWAIGGISLGTPPQRPLATCLPKQEAFSTSPGQRRDWRTGE